jgi:hypothetical protein
LDIFSYQIYSFSMPPNALSNTPPNLRVTEIQAFVPSKDALAFCIAAALTYHRTARATRALPSHAR